jgi:hypothetical protein
MKSVSNYKVSHPIYGIWWATSLYGVAKTIGCHPTYLYNNKGKNEIKGWTYEETDQDFSDIPAKYINAENEFVKKFHMQFMMEMEEMNADPEFEEIEITKNQSIDPHFIMSEVKQIIENQHKDEWLIKKFAFEYGIKNYNDLKIN